ncbi:MmgE/PrpD family protein [Kordiimonas pumila]|uniref:MmgE/PrpD family protein n=1 Tax=Kordiimonas pumila TaxID=2161677 RepID=A0ABV7D9D1_9PROT|nr:MmgE/PrpD family protein [Kordiimonas pumila]
MKLHTVTVWPSTRPLEKQEQLAWKMAALGVDVPKLDADVREMVINRLIDNTAVGIASLNRPPVVAARAQALAHPRANGAGLLGCGSDVRVDAEWAAWANGVAVRELDYHDTFLAADYAHPADCIPALLAVAQQCGRSGSDLMKAIAVSYEVHVALVKAICLHKHKIDHIAHLGPAIAVGLGALLELDQETIYQAVQQTLHVCCTTRQSRKGMISSWKAFAPAHAGKLAIEAVDRAMRGEKAPSPIYEGEDSFIAYMLDGPDAIYTVSLPEKGQSLRAIMETYTKAYSAEYQSQALLDLAFSMRQKITNLSDVEEVVIYTSHHTHNVIGTGAADPEKMDPLASRETLDHSIMYIFAVALEDGTWHHIKSYPPARHISPETIRLWHCVRTEEDSLWTRRYHAENPADKAFGGRVIIRLKDGVIIEEELSVADAHPHGKHPFVRENYIAKFTLLTEGLVTVKSQQDFLWYAAHLEELDIASLSYLLPADAQALEQSDLKGIF